MTVTWEKHFWCDDCKRHHRVKLHSKSELSQDDKATFFTEGEYADQLRKHAVCTRCGGNIIPHQDLDIVSINDEWKEICRACARNLLKIDR